MDAVGGGAAAAFACLTLWNQFILHGEGVASEDTHHPI